MQSVRQPVQVLKPKVLVGGTEMLLPQFLVDLQHDGVYLVHGEEQGRVAFFIEVKFHQVRNILATVFGCAETE